MVMAVVLLATTATAQKKEISKARDFIKSGAYDKAEALMTDLLKKDTANQKEIKIYLTWYDAVVGQYKAANEKLYLKQKYDTVAFYNLIYKMQQVALDIDTLDMMPDHKGRVKTQYRENHAEELNRLRPNLYYGGTFLIRKGSYDRAFDFFNMYIEADQQPLFTGYEYVKKDAKMPEAAYWATFCGYKLKNPALTQKHAALALKDVNKAQFTLQYLCEAYKQLNDEENYVKTLSKGFHQFPKYPYFFPRLADYYTTQNRNDSVLAIADKGLMADADNTLFQLAKSVALLNLERYDDCIASSKELIRVKSKQPEPYYNIATCYLNQALIVEQENEPRKNRMKLVKLYTEAKPYMEKYRELAPDEKARWAPGLYRIYLNLNMGKEFDEIDKVMRK